MRWGMTGGLPRALSEHPARCTIIAVVLVLACYLPSIDAPFFHVDDYQYVAGNAALEGTPLSQPWRFFTQRTNPWEYLPLRDLSYRLDLAVFGRNPLGFRVHNLALYAACCAALWFCARSISRILRPGSHGEPERPAREAWFAAGVTMLFAAHPSHAESVAWIAGRKDLLSGLFALLSLWMFLEGTHRARASRGRLLASYTLFLLAILSKSSVVAMPAAAFLLAVAGERSVQKGWRALLRPALVTAPLAVLCAASIGLQIFASETSALRMETMAGRGWRPEHWDLPLNILGMLSRIALFPLELRIAYDVQPPGAAGWAIAALGCLTAASAAAGIWMTLRRHNIAGYGLAFFGILSLPFLQLIPFNTWSYAAERFLFLPVAGLAMTVAAWAGARPARFRTSIALVVFLSGTGLTLQRAREWSSGPEILRLTSERCPSHDGAARLYIHYVLLNDLRFDDARSVASHVRDPDARVFLQTYVDAKQALHDGNLPRVRDLGVKLLPAAPREDVAVLTDIANLVMEAGLHAEAEAAYRTLLAEPPERPEIRYNLGLALAKQGQHADAAREIRSAIAGGHTAAIAWNNLGLAEKNAGAFARAETAFRSAVDADPRHWHAAYNLARMLVAAGDQASAAPLLATARARARANGQSTAPIDDLLRHLDHPTASSRP